MKYLIPVALMLLTLCGCASDPVPDTPPATVPAPTEPAVITSIYDPQSLLEQTTGGSIRVYPLERDDCTGIFSMGKSLLVFSGRAETTITKYSGSDLSLSAVTRLNCTIHPSDPGVLIDENGITYYDSYHNQLVYLNENLQEVMRIKLPDARCGTPALTADRMKLYYCTPNALRCLDLETGLDRLVKQMSFASQTVVASHCGDTVIACEVQDHDAAPRQIFLSAENGLLLQETAADTIVSTNGAAYLAVCQDGSYPELLIGDSEQGPTLLMPHTYNSSIHPIMENTALVLATENTLCNTLQLDYYNLQKGNRAASLTLADTDAPFGFYADGTSVWFLRYDPRYRSHVLCQWDVSRSDTENEPSCLSTRYGAQKPDYDGIAACRTIADRLSVRYGVQILLWDDAVAYQPAGYHLIPEHQVPVIQDGLTKLEDFLALYPRGFLQTAGANTGSFRIQICLVRSITESVPAEETPSMLDGLQYWDENTNAYLCLAANQDQFIQTACRELFHILDSRVLTFSKAYDDWNKLNPKEFVYLPSDAARRWLEGPERAFLDAASMTYPKEDRARIMACAMLRGNESCFESETMQKKLRQLCLGIREAFGLKKSTDTFLWEQYLKEPIA